MQKMPRRIKGSKRNKISRGQGLRLPSQDDAKVAIRNVVVLAAADTEAIPVEAADAGMTAISGLDSAPVVPVLHKPFLVGRAQEV